MKRVRVRVNEVSFNLSLQNTTTTRVRTELNEANVAIDVTLSRDAAYNLNTHLPMYHLQVTPNLISGQRAICLPDHHLPRAVPGEPLIDGSG